MSNQTNTSTGEIVSIGGGVVEHEAVMGAVRRRMELEGFSLADVSKQTGMPESTLSQMLNNKYQGRVDVQAQKLVAWVKQGRETAELNAIAPVIPLRIETPTAKRINQTLRYAHLRSDLSCIYGGAGLGKTTELRHYKGRQGNVWLYTATPIVKGIASLLRGISGAIGLDARYVYGDAAYEGIVRKVQGSSGLLIVDEAQHLPKACLEMLRAIQDASAVDTTAPTMGLALVGNASVYSNITRGADNGFAQMTSRIGRRLALAKPMPGDVKAIARHFKVEGDAEMRLLASIANKPGALRMVVKTLSLAATFADGKATDAMHIRTAWDELQGETLGAEVAHA